MTLNPTEFLDKLKGGELDRQDRYRLDAALLFCAGVVIGLLIWKPPVDTKVVELAMSNAWITGMVALIVYVFGVRAKHQRPQPQPSPTTINIGAQDAPSPAPIAAAVKEVKADTKAIRKKVKA